MIARICFLANKVSMSEKWLTAFKIDIFRIAMIILIIIRYSWYTGLFSKRLVASNWIFHAVSLWVGQQC